MADGSGRNALLSPIRQKLELIANELDPGAPAVFASGEQIVEAEFAHGTDVAAIAPDESRIPFRRGMPRDATVRRPGIDQQFAPVVPEGVKYANGKSDAEIKLFAPKKDSAQFFKVSTIK